MKISDRQLKNLCQEESPRMVKTLLETPYWLATLTADTNYERTHDDHDGTFEGNVAVFFDQMGDGFLVVDKAHKYLRFRTWGGGGMSLRVRNALMILAEAIRLDNEEIPQRSPQSS